MSLTLKVSNVGRTDPSSVPMVEFCNHM